MKTTKKIFAALLVVMMIAMMVPFTASAAADYSYTLTGKTGYKVTVYKVAEFNETTGEFTATDSSVQAILNAGNEDKTLLAACDALTNLSGGKEVDFNTNVTQTVNGVEPGAYYVKVTTTPAGVKSVTNSVFTLPTNENEKSITVNVASKVDDDQPTVSKKIVDGDNRVDEISQFIGKDVQFELKGSVVGSATQNLKKYVFTDTMSAGLTFKSVDSVVLTAEGKADKAITDYTVSDVVNNVFTVSLNNTVFSDATLYDYTNVVVKYTATLNENAVIAGDGNTNKVDLSYTDSYGNDADVEGNTVKVYTAKIDVVKVDAADATTKLSGAEFTLYTDKACTTEATNGATVTTDENGTASFKGLAKGTYYLKETKAPAGYNLNSTVFEITVGATGSVTGTNVVNGTITVNDSKLVVPQTGGMGTMIFTIVGLSLIACAGVLFVVVRRKRTSK